MKLKVDDVEVLQGTGNPAFYRMQQVKQGAEVAEHDDDIEEIESGDAWIISSDEVLRESIVRHEGSKDVIYSRINRNTLLVAEGCDAAACMAAGTWPAYVDSKNLDTVGVGHLITGDETYDCYAGVSDADVFKQLSDDLETHLAAAKRLAGQHAMQIGGNDTVQRFMTEMCFNIGARKYAGFKNGLRKLQSAVNGDGLYTYNDAADEHLDSKWATDVGNRANEMVDTLRALD